MTTADLIEILKSLPSDTNVIIDHIDKNNVPVERDIVEVRYQPKYKEFHLATYFNSLFESKNNEIKEESDGKNAS